MLDYYACIIIGVDAYNSIKMGPTPISAIPKMALSAFLSFFFLFEGVVFLYSPPPSSFIGRVSMDGYICIRNELPS
jgi:hypothetical protein